MTWTLPGLMQANACLSTQMPGFNLRYIQVDCAGHGSNWTRYLPRILIFKRLTARRLYKSFVVKGLMLFFLLILFPSLLFNDFSRL
jgi:hypothetical protein